MNAAKLKSYSILGLFVLTLLSIWAANSVWLHFEFEAGAAVVQGVSVTGAEALSALFPILVAFLAIGATFFITKKIVRVVLAALVLLLAVWIVQASFGVYLAGEAGAYVYGGTKIVEATGLAAGQHSALIAEASLTNWALVQTLFAGLIGLLAVLVLVTGHRWPAGGRKYEKSSPNAVVTVKDDRISAWDALSDGEDPSDDTAGASS